MSMYDTPLFRAPTRMLPLQTHDCRCGTGSKDDDTRGVGCVVLQKAGVVAIILLFPSLPK